MRKVRESHFPISLFFIIFGTLLLMSGMHYGLIVLFDEWNVPDFIRVTTVMLYWFLVAAGVTLYTRRQMRRFYEEPMKQLAEATEAVSHGDFSVYMAPYHTADKLDYLDVMLMDFNKMVEELGSIETLKTDFVSNVSHEIKTPMAVIFNYAQLLKADDKLTTEQREYVNGIYISTKKLDSLISNILKLNRLEKQSIQPELRKYDLCEQLCECIMQFENRWEEKNIDLAVDIEERAWIMGDASLLELVWNNLLSNAVKFTEPAGKVVISEQSLDQEVVVEVSDSGCGISEETIGYIFDKFYQGDTSHSTEGNGLGLALVFRVLQLSGGRIEVESEEGKGTKFTVHLPLQKELL